MIKEPGKLFQIAEGQNHLLGFHINYTHQCAFPYSTYKKIQLQNHLYAFY